MRNEELRNRKLKIENGKGKIENGELRIFNRVQAQRHTGGDECR